MKWRSLELVFIADSGPVVLCDGIRERRRPHVPDTAGQEIRRIKSKVNQIIWLCKRLCCHNYYWHTIDSSLMSTKYRIQICFYRLYYPKGSAPWPAPTFPPGFELLSQNTAYDATSNQFILKESGLFVGTFYLGLHRILILPDSRQIFPYTGYQKRPDFLYNLNFIA